MATPAAIQVKNATIGHGKHSVLDNISFDIQAGGITMLIGPNGSGKTTLLRTIAGFLPTLGGNVYIHGKAPGKARSMIGYVPQRFQIDPTLPLTVEEFLRLSTPSREGIQEALDDIGMQNTATRQLRHLSGGQQQRVLIARALLNKPSILLFDEPVAGIDIAGEDNIYRTLKHIQQQHTKTIVMISHEIEMVHSIADEVICINKELLCHGVPSEALSSEVVEKVFGVTEGHRHIHEHHD